MTENRLTKLLIGLGLNEMEAKVYLAGLSLGPTTILKLARTSELKRTTIYSIVESLKQKGLVVTEMRGFKKYLLASAPEQLESMLNQQRERLQLAMPDLMSLHRLAGEGGAIKYYEGLEAIKSVYEGLIKDVRPREDYLVMSDQSRWLNLDKEYFLDFLRRRAKLPINIRMLLQDSPIAREHQRIQKTFNEKIKILPPRTKLTTNLVVIPRRVVIHQLVPPLFAIVIENQSVTQMHQQQFEIIWESIRD
jgi:sugar-specific transcriptional regulator TrmB